MVGRTAAQGRIPALKRTVFTSHGENARRIGRIRVSRLSPVRFGRKERRISRGVFCPLQNVGKMWRLVGGERGI
jgi:hypothetical protein